MRSALIVAACAAAASAMPHDAIQHKERLLSKLSAVTSKAHPSVAKVAMYAGSAILDARSNEDWLALGSNDSKWCPANSYFEVFPALAAQPSTHNPTVTWQGDGCFTSMTATATITGQSATVTITGTGATSLLCSDLYVVSSLYGITVAEVSALSPSKAVTLTFGSASEATEASINGMRVFLMPCGVIGSVSSIINTVGLFTSTNETTLADTNIDFLRYRGVWPNPSVPFGKQVMVDKKLIRSGSYLAIGKLDGLDPMIMFGTMGRTGHSALAVWRNDDLYVLESTDANPFGKVYWPPPYGIRLTQWDEWVTLAQAADYHVGLLQMTSTYTAAFNETAFWNWFDQVQGMPYGYHTMLFSFLDVTNQNLPQPVVMDFLGPVFNLLDHILPNTTSDVSVFSMFTWGMNKRLGSSCDTFACILDNLVANLQSGNPINSVGAITSIPDSDNWMFGKNYSMVCSQFAAHGWKVGFQNQLPVWQSIIAAEQTPKDNYQMALYDGAFWNNSNCPGGVTEGDQNGVGTYCQLMGEYQLLLNGFNSVPLYAGMNNACSGQWPSFNRCPNGQTSCTC